MTRHIKYTDKAPTPPRTFSKGAKATGLVFVSGHGPFDPTTSAVVGDTILLQTWQRLSNIQAVLEATGSRLDNIVSATVILVDEADFAGMNED